MLFGERKKYSNSQLLFGGMVKAELIVICQENKTQVCFHQISTCVNILNLYLPKIMKWQNKWTLLSSGKNRYETDTKISCIQIEGMLIYLKVV